MRGEDDKADWMVDDSCPCMEVAVEGREQCWGVLQADSLLDLQRAHVSSDFLMAAVTSTMERKMNNNVVMGWAAMFYPIYRSF